jgi:autotransporter translocation and assembly factor TamB
MLIFGKSKDDLEQGQAGMMADRAGQVLASYGSVQLEDWASGQLGVDVVSIAPSEEHDDANSLVVGKYLQPDVVVRYERVMDEESDQYVHLDYLWTTYFKVHTEIYNGGSGLELVWYIDR